MKLTKIIIILTALLLFSAVPTMAADVQLAWDNPSGQAWDEVRIYDVASGTPVLKKAVAGNLTQTTITDLEPGQYVFMARSYMNGSESNDSNNLSKEVKPDAPILRIIAVEIHADGTMTFKLVDPAEFFLS